MKTSTSYSDVALIIICSMKSNTKIPMLIVGIVIASIGLAMVLLDIFDTAAGNYIKLPLYNVRQNISSNVYIV